ncbi:hypothetical protein Tco_0855085 [Tanacetum coccineum]
MDTKARTRRKARGHLSNGEWGVAKDGHQSGRPCGNGICREPVDLVSPGGMAMDWISGGSGDWGVGLVGAGFHGPGSWADSEPVPWAGSGQVMAISVISVSPDLSEECGNISWTSYLTPTEIPTISPIVSPSPDYTPTSPDYSPASDTKPDLSVDLSSDHIPLLPTISPFLSSTDDPLDSDTPDTPPSPTHGAPFTEITLSTQRSPATSGALCLRVMILAPEQPIPHGRPYRYHPNRPVHMMTMRKRVGPLPTYCLALRHSIDYSSSDLFTSDDSSRDSPSDSSSETSSDSSDALSDYSFGHSSSDNSSPALPSALSPARADLLPPPKWIRSSDSVTDLKDCSDESSESFVPRETSLRDDVDVKGSDEPYSEPGINLKVQAEIDKCIAYANALRAGGIDVMVVIETISREEVETSTMGPIKVKVDRVMHPAVLDDIPNPAQEKGAIKGTYETLGDLVQRFHDHTVEIPVHRVQVIESIQRDQGHMIVAMSQQSVVLLERISELEQDNTRLRGTLDVAT